MLRNILNMREVKFFVVQSVAEKESRIQKVSKFLENRRKKSKVDESQMEVVDRRPTVASPSQNKKGIGVSTGKSTKSQQLEIFQYCSFFIFYPWDSALLGLSNFAAWKFCNFVVLGYCGSKVEWLHNFVDLWCCKLMMKGFAVVDLRFWVFQILRLCAFVLLLFCAIALFHFCSLLDLKFCRFVMLYCLNILVLQFCHLQFYKIVVLQFCSFATLQFANFAVFLFTVLISEEKKMPQLRTYSSIALL